MAASDSASIASKNTIVDFYLKKALAPQVNY